MEAGRTTYNTSISDRVAAVMTTPALAVEQGGAMGDRFVRHGCIWLGLVLVVLGACGPALPHWPRW